MVKHFILFPRVFNTWIVTVHGVGKQSSIMQESYQSLILLYIQMGVLADLEPSDPRMTSLGLSKTPVTTIRRYGLYPSL